MESQLTNAQTQGLTFVSKLIEERGILQDALIALKVRLEVPGNVPKDELLNIIEDALDKAH